MAHFAKLDENGVVLEVHCVHNDELLVDGVEVEAKGVEFLTNWSGGYTNWKQTSYNGNFRKRYAGVGYSYDAQRDAFIPPQTYPSWVLDENTCTWQAPVPMPEGGGLWAWSETIHDWLDISGA